MEQLSRDDLWAARCGKWMGVMTPPTLQIPGDHLYVGTLYMTVIPRDRLKVRHS